MHRHIPGHHTYVCNRDPSGHRAKYLGDEAHAKAQEGKAIFSCWDCGAAVVYSAEVESKGAKRRKTNTGLSTKQKRGITTMATKYNTVKELVEEMLLGGKSTEEIIEAVGVNFPESNADNKSIAWYRHNLRQQGKLPKVERKTTAKKSAPKTKAKAKAPPKTKAKAAPKTKATPKTSGAKKKAAIRKKLAKAS